MKKVKSNILNKALNAFYKKAAFFIVFSFALLSGCASTEDMGKMQWDINNVKAEINRMKKTTPVSYQKGEVDEKLRTIDEKQSDIEERQDATSKTVSDLLIQIQNLTSELQVLTGRFEESRFFTEKSSSELLDSNEKMITRLKDQDITLVEMNKQVEEIRETLSTVQSEVAKINQERKAEKDAKKAAERKKAEEAARKKKKAAEAKSKKSELKDKYMAGYESFKKGKTKEARETFKSVINDYGENEYSDNARFWLGESYYKDGNYEDAILAYDELFKNNPKSDKIPGAMLKQGLAFYSLKDKKTGQIILEMLIEKYPDSEQAKLAKKKIQRPSPPKKKTN